MYVLIKIFSVGKCCDVIAILLLPLVYVVLSMRLSIVRRRTHVRIVIRIVIVLVLSHSFLDW